MFKELISSVTMNHCVDSTFTQVKTVLKQKNLILSVFAARKMLTLKHRSKDARQKPGANNYSKTTKGSLPEHAPFLAPLLFVFLCLVKSILVHSSETDILISWNTIEQILGKLY